MTPRVALRVGGFFLAVFTWSCVVHAQDALVRGRVLGPDALPRERVLVQVSNATGDSTIARVITSASGGFAFRTSLSTVRLRVLAVGFAPVEAGLHHVRPGGAEVIIRTTLNVVRLEAIVSQATALCSPESGGREPAALLLAEAQKALTLAAYATESARPTARYALLSWTAEPSGQPRGERSVRIGSGPSLRPFQSVPPALIEREGWVHAEDDGTTYRAPDAALLASEQFAREHCFRVETPASPLSPLVGVSFEPANRRSSLAQLRGVLWLDARSYELSRVDFAYDNVPREVATSLAGGSIHLTRLPNGLWFEERWELRMPRVLEQRSVADVSRGGAAMRTRTVESLHVLAGQVLELRIGSTVLFSVPDAGFPTADSASATSTSNEPSAVSDSLFGPSLCGPDAEKTEPTSRLVGVLSPASIGDERARVTLEWREQFRVDGAHQWRWSTRVLETTVGSSGRFDFCGVPRDRALALRAVAGARRAGPLVLRIASDDALARVTVQLPELVTRADLVRVRISTTEGNPVPYAVVSVDGGTPRIADAEGVVSIEAASGRAMRVLARRIGFAPADTTLMRVAEGDQYVVTIGPRVQELTAVRVIANRSVLETRGFYDRAARVQRGAMTADFLTPEQLDLRSSSLATQHLMLSRFVTLGWSQEERPRRVAVGRGGCKFEVLLDGQRVNIRTRDGHVPIDDVVSGPDITAIEVYPSIANAPAELIPLTGDGCGLIAIWTGGREP